MQKISTIAILLSVVILVGAGCVKTNPTPVTETENTQPPITNAVPAPGTTTTEMIVEEQTDTKPNSDKPLDLSQYKTSMSIMVIDQNKTYTAKMKTTAGDMEISLNAAATPITVNNFVFLAKKNFYDNVIFHRVIKGFMIQGGDPTGTGTGGPGYKFDDEPFTGEYSKGTLAMANSGPNTNGSQFFIMHGDVPLQKDYVIFGKVTKGLDVVDKIATAPTTMGMMGEMSTPVTPVKILSVEIVEN